MPDWTVQERYQKYECKHEKTRPTYATKSNGVVCVYLQCVECGEKTKEERKAGYDVAKLPPFDKELQERTRNKLREISAQLWSDWQEERQREFENKQGKQNEDFWRKYNAYLQTPHWKQVRRRVLIRDSFLCQNCFTKLTDSNAHVHHISYEAYKRLGYSFAFECVSLCRTCHDDYHRG